MKKFLFLFAIWLITTPVCRAQEISGNWTGDFYNESLTNLVPTNSIQLHLEVDKKGNVKGTTLLQYNNGHEYYMILGRYNPKSKQLYFKEFYRISTKGFGFYRTGSYQLKLKTLKGKLLLDGIWSDNKPQQWNSIENSRVYFIKKLPPTPPPSQVPPPTKQNTIAAKPIKQQPKPEAPRIIPPMQRKPDLQSDILLTLQAGDTLRLELMDNGEIDGDIVSIYLDGKSFLRKVVLGSTPIVILIPFTKGVATREMSMIAESMGSTPPCTAYLRIIEPNKEQAISLSSKLNSNAVVRFRLKP